MNDTCEELERNGTDPDPESVPYDHLPHPETPEGFEDIFYAAYAIESIGRVLLGHSAESGDGDSVNWTPPARPLTGFAYQGLLHAVALLASGINDDLARKKDYRVRRGQP
jgi:hypothetical protein